MPAGLPWDKDGSVSLVWDCAQHCVENDTAVARNRGCGSSTRGSASGTTRARRLAAMNWAHVGTVILAAFLASLVECVEALTIVLAVGTTRGWRPALTGAGAGALVLTALTLVAGPALQRIPLTSLQLVIGVLLLAFGVRWLVKAILRASGVIALHDEAAIYAKEKAELARDRGGERVALLTAFTAVI